MDVPSGKRFALPTEAQEYAARGGCYNSEPYTCTSSYHGREQRYNRFPHRFEMTYVTLVQLPPEY